MEIIFFFSFWLCLAQEWPSSRKSAREIIPFFFNFHVTARKNEWGKDPCTYPLIQEVQFLVLQSWMPTLTDWNYYHNSLKNPLSFSGHVIMEPILIFLSLPPCRAAIHSWVKTQCGSTSLPKGKFFNASQMQLLTKVPCYWQWMRRQLMAGCYENNACTHHFPPDFEA